jgi:two-component system, NtrC family, C4-dicarboxylate transport sensor histidine kinase DctB
VRRAIGLRAYAIGRAGIALTADVPEREPLTATGNAVELQQAILNLMTNAEQALAGRPQAAITVALRDESGGVALRVADNGPGIPHALRTQVFEPFFTTHSRSDFAGLGLSAARRIAMRCGGTLDLEESAAGASFVMRLPKG